MSEDREGFDVLRRAIDRVAADLPEPDTRLPDRGRRLHPGRAAALAAAAVAAILAYPVYLGTVRLPRLEAERAASEGLAPGPADLQVIPVPRSGLRDASPAREIEIRAPRAGREAGGWILLLDLDLRALESELRGGAVIEILRDDGSELGSWVLGPSQLRTYRELDEGLPLLLAAGSLPPGRYHLRVRADGSGGDPAPVAAIELRVVPPS